MGDLFDRAVSDIEAAYERLGHTLGRRFLTTPRRTLSNDAKVALLTLNPGGDAIDYANDGASCEDGSAYVREQWGDYRVGAAPLQKQVQLMFDWLGLDPNTTLSAYFIPFRSPCLKALKARQQSVEFAITLWQRIFEEVRPGLVVCLGKDVEGYLKDVWGHPIKSTPYPVGWGRQTAVLSRYPRHLLLRSPHLSHFAIFGRHDSAEPLRKIRRDVERLGLG